MMIKYDKRNAVMVLYLGKKSLCPFFGPKGPKTVPTLGNLEIFEKKKMRFFFAILSKKNQEFFFLAPF